MQTGESRQARHICAVCFVHPYVHYAHVRCNACNMHVYKSIYLYACVCICMYVCMYVCVCVYILMYKRTGTVGFRHVDTETPALLS